jgi:dolichol-phosphate mannosyltransferase
MRSDLCALVVIPTFNESQNIRSIVERILDTPEFGVLIVDDHSPDGTGRIADELAAAHPGRVGVLHRDGVRGLGLSYREGFAAAIESGVPVIVQMDADWSHDPVYLPEIYEAARLHDVIVGSRYIPGGAVVDWPRRRRFLSVWANRYIRLITRLTTKDCTSGFRAWRRETLARIPLRQLTSEGYAFQVEMLCEADARGQRIHEVPIVFVERRAGASKLSHTVLFESVLMPWRLLIRRLRGDWANGARTW